MVTKFISPQDPTAPLVFNKAVESGNIWDLYLNDIDWRLFTTIRRSVTTQEMFQVKTDDECTCDDNMGYSVCQDGYSRCDMTLPADEVEDFWMRRGWVPSRCDLECDRKGRGVA